MTLRDGSSRSGRTGRLVATAAVAEATADRAVEGLPGDLQRICRGAISVLSLQGSALFVMTLNASGTVAASSDEASRLIAETVFETGEGPSLDSYSYSRPVLVPALLEEGSGRWPGYVSAVRHTGVRACFSFPLHVGAVRFGVLDLYARRIGGLGADDLSMALTFADLAIERLLRSGGPGEELDERLRYVVERRSEIHQAQGMVMVDLEVDLPTALDLMRASAFRRNLALVEVAQEVLAGARLPSPDGYQT